MCDEHVDDVSLHTYIQTYISTGDFLYVRFMWVSLWLAPITYHAEKIWAKLFPSLVEFIYNGKRSLFPLLNLTQGKKMHFPILSIYLDRINLIQWWWGLTWTWQVLLSSLSSVVAFNTGTLSQSILHAYTVIWADRAISTSRRRVGSSETLCNFKVPFS